MRFLDELNSEIAPPEVDVALSRTVFDELFPATKKRKGAMYV